jgi:ETC complex I subunit conserved region
MLTPVSRQRDSTAMAACWRLAKHVSDTVMTARIYKPAKTAMQSGYAKTKDWVLDYEPEEPRVVEALMGWTSSGDMKSQLRLIFATKEEAIAYAERHGIAYQVFEAKPVARRGLTYADNFAFNRRDAWTH